ncbi:MAG: agmatine/peptidylarginine deiminase [Rhodothermales bacterium]
MQISSKIQALLPRPTPHSLGYRMPAEWHPHEGTWFSWPHNPDTWVRHLPAAERALAEAVGWLAKGETVHINVLDKYHRDHVATILQDAGINEGIAFHLFPTNDSWCRDHGAIFLVHPEEPGYAAIDWGFNAWGEKYPPFDLDNAIPRQMADVMQARLFESPFILEGGSIEVNGAGTLLTTETCLLNPNRNPGYQKTDIEWLLKEMFGVHQVVWLAGDLVGDDTDGHIDNLARFVDEGTIVVPVEANPDDPNYASLAANFALLQQVKNAKDEAFEIITLPMPAPYFIDGHRLPANYVNFYIGNGVVLMPTFGDPNDEVALSMLQSCFKDRQMVPINCREIIWGLGALHCLSQQVPRSYTGDGNNF